jgi:uncharacterized protein YcfL
MRYFAMLILLVLIAGCGGVRAPIEPRQDPYAPGQIHMTGSDLRRYTAVGTPVLARDEATNLLYVDVPIRNTRNMQVHVDYRVTFFDRNRQTIWQSGWMSKVLPPHVPERIRVNSPSQQAADFQMDLRYAQ